MKIKWIYLLFCFPVLILLAGDNEKEKIKSFDLDNFQESTNTKDLLLEEKNKDSDSSSFDLTNSPEDTSAKESAFSKLISKQTFDDNSLYMFVVNVGQGNFILLRKGENAILVDAGSNSKEKVSIYIESYFESCMKGAMINAVIITHLDKDHYNYLKENYVKNKLDKKAPFFITFIKFFSKLMLDNW